MAYRSNNQQSKGLGGFFSRLFRRLAVRIIVRIILIFLIIVYAYSLRTNKGFLSTIGELCEHPFELITPIKQVVEIPKQPFAMKVVERSSNTSPPRAAVQIVYGSRWRIEEKDQSGAVVVGICDGSESMCNIPGASATNLDPRPLLYWALTFSAAYKDTSSLTQRVTETFDGHTCWKTNAHFEGTPMQIWIDSTDGMPVCVFGSGGGKYIDSHFSRLPIDFTNPGTNEFFNTTHLTPFFTNYLTP